MARLVRVLALVLSVGMARPVSADSLFLPGTGDSQVLLRLLAADFGERTGHQIIIPDSIGSSGGIRQVLSGKAVMARVARPLSSLEQQAGLTWFLFARSPVVFAVRSEGPRVDNLTSPQIELIFSGKLRSWKDVGGPDATIYVAQREKGDSSRSVLEKYFPAFASGNLAGEVLLSTPVMTQTLVRYPGSIGYLPLSATLGHPLKVLAIDGRQPDEEAVATGDYPFVVPLALVWKDTPTGVAEDFVRYLSSKEARNLMRKSGALPATPVP